jgi:UDP-3-O-[3-hydroxymyristoyl] glucosamine N-acyltransferase
MKLKEIAAKVGCPFTGDGDQEISGVKSAETATPGDITFIMNSKYKGYLETSGASAFIIPDAFPETDRNVIRSSNSYLTFAAVLELFYKQPLPHGPFVHPTAIVAENVKMGENCYIGAYVVIDEDVRLGDNVRILPKSTIYRGATIGDDVLIHAHCVIREYCEIGDRVILQNGAVIGADGFGFAKTSSGEYRKILQAGRVILEDDVEIQANACVDRGTLDPTVIRKGTKVDNLVQIAHGCEVGENCVLAAQVGLAGSTKVGDNVMLAGQVGVAGHCIIGDNVIATAQTGIPSSVEKDKIVSGTPSIDNKLWLRSSVALTKLPQLLNRVRELENKIQKLTENKNP